MNEWISVEDRLPEMGGPDVLMYMVDDLIYVGYIGSDGCWYTVSTDGWDQAATEDVLFWMPVPDPPKGRGAE